MTDDSMTEGTLTEGTLTEGTRTGDTVTDRARTDGTRPDDASRAGGGETVIGEKLAAGSSRTARVPQRDRLLTPGEVATLFRVDPKTVTRWASAGRIGSIRTPGGHRRFRESEVRALLRGEVLDAIPVQPAG